MAALASVTAMSRRLSLPPSESAPIPAFEKLANTKVKAWRKAGRAGKGKKTAMGPMFGTTWGEDTLQIPYDECAVCAPAPSLEWGLDWVSRDDGQQEPA